MSSQSLQRTVSPCSTEEQGVENTWDSFFHAEEQVTDDFMTERATQEQQEREGF